MEWTNIKIELDKINWTRLCSNLTAERIYKLIIDVVVDICAKFVPKKSYKPFRKIPRDRRILMRNRSKIRKKLEKPISVRTKAELLKKIELIEVKLINSHTAERSWQELSAVDKIRNNSKFFFKYARDKSHVKSPVGPLSLDGEVLNDPKAMCDILKRQFESVYSIPINSACIENILSEPGPRCIDDLDFSGENIYENILKISKNAAPGPDGIPAIFLRQCAQQMKTPIFLLWRASLNEGSLPDELKQSKVVPIFKGGDRCNPENYRPISLTSHLSKTFERIIVKKLTSYLDSMELFNKNQHGFRAGRSCVSQLLEHQMKILSYLEEGKEVDVVYLDFAKAFDKVDYGVLLQKLKYVGISGSLLRWINSFLTGRKQRVCVEGVLSSPAPVVSGVPQGSALGPLLFLVHISDIDDDLQHVKAASFADDTRLIMKVENSEDQRKMQEDLDKIYQWASQNNMCFNGNKFELMRYGKVHSNCSSYSRPDGGMIGEVSEVRDLGILMAKSATFDSEIGKIILKSNRQAGWILRVFKTREELPMMTLYRALIRPHLEYCCQVWSPITVGTIRRIEGVQRSYTARIARIGHLNYWERLKHLRLYSLERRRERYQLIYVFKLMMQLVPNIESERFNLKFDRSERRGRFCKIPPIITSASSRLKTMTDGSFAVRGPKLFNVLPMKLRNFEGSMDSFKVALDKFLCLIPDQPCTSNYHQPAASNSLIDQLAQMRVVDIAN